jgi:tetrahydromethanopterin S-methyltransferase subunit G
MEKLTVEDALMIENVVNKMNEIIDRLDAVDKRMDNHWSYHRHLKEKDEKKE